jgi:hypothetical protein
MQLAASALTVTLLSAAAAPRPARAGLVRAPGGTHDSLSARFFLAPSTHAASAVQPPRRRRMHAGVVCAAQPQRARAGAAAAPKHTGVGHWLADAVKEAFSSTADAHGMTWTPTPYSGTPLHAADHHKLARVEQVMSAARTQLLSTAAGGGAHSAAAPAPTSGAKSVPDMGALHLRACRAVPCRAVLCARAARCTRLAPVCVVAVPPASVLSSVWR